MHSILKPLPFFLGVAILGCFVYFSIVRTPAYSEPDIPFELHQVNTHLAQLQNRVKQLDALRANAEFHEEPNCCKRNWCNARATAGKRLS